MWESEATGEQQQVTQNWFQFPSPLGTQEGAGASVGGVKGPSLVPLHIPDAPDGLNLGVLGTKL